MKKAVIILLLLTVVMTFFGAQSVRAIHPDTAIYEEPSFSSVVLFQIPQNAQIILLKTDIMLDGVSWSRVQYGDYIGYLPSSDLYNTDNAISYSLTQIKATSTKMGESIYIYKSNSTDSTLIATVKDGTKMTKVNSNIDYGDFYEVTYKSQRAFIQQKYATTGLTYNQKTALIIAAITIVTVALMFFLIRLIKTHRRKVRR